MLNYLLIAAVTLLSLERLFVMNAAKKLPLKFRVKFQNVLPVTLKLLFVFDIQQADFIIPLYLLDFTGQQYAQSYF